MFVKFLQEFCIQSRGTFFLGKDPTRTSRNQILKSMVPYIPMLREDNVRKGFFEHAEFLALRDALPDHLKGFVTFGYKTGWRFSEIAGLTWNQIDLSQNTARLEAGETKDREGRTVWLDDEVKAVIHEQWEKRK